MASLAWRGLLASSAASVVIKPRDASARGLSFRSSAAAVVVSEIILKPNPAELNLGLRVWTRCIGESLARSAALGVGLVALFVGHDDFLYQRMSNDVDVRKLTDRDAVDVLQQGSGFTQAA